MLGWNWSAGFAMLVGAALKSTFVLGAAWLLAFALRRRSAAARHLVWTAAAAALLALPVLSLSLPVLPVRAGALAPLLSTVTFRSTAVATAAAPVPSHPLTAREPRPPKSSPWRSDFQLWLALLWAAGTALALAHMLAAWFMMWRVRRSARPISDTQLFRALARTLGLRQNIDLLEIPRGGMPMSFGIVRSAVFLPADAGEWSEDRRRVVMLHELAHVKRGDLTAHVLVRAALSLFWWNPLAWMAWREFVKERERAADDLVLTAGEPATAYASHLLEIARSMQGAPTAWAALAMARPSQLEGRLLAILDSRINRKSPGPRSGLLAAGLAVALVAPFAALQAQEKIDPAMMPPIEETIRAAIAQQNHEILDSAAAAYEKVRKYAAAQNLLENALTIRAQKSGDRSAAYAAGLVKLGDLSTRQGQVEEGEAFYRKAVALGDTPETAPALIKLANLALARKNPVEAGDLIERALHASPAGPAAGQALLVKGNIAVANGLPGVAELQYLQALAQNKGDTPETALALETYAGFLTGQSRADEAKVLKDRAVAIRTARVAELSPRVRPVTETPGTSATSSAQVSYQTGEAVVASAVTAPPKIVRIGAGVSAPVLLYKKEPEYSEEARASQFQGTVLLHVVIGPDGQAYDISLLKSLGFGLDEKAVDAVAQWKFVPGKRAGIPVYVEATIEVNFRLL